MKIISGSLFGSRDIQKNRKNDASNLKSPSSNLTFTSQDTVHFGRQEKTPAMPDMSGADQFVHAQSEKAEKPLATNHLDIHRTYEHGETILMKVAERGHSLLVDYFIKAGSVINQADDKGQTALIKAAANGHEDAVKTILDAMPDEQSKHALINHTDKSGNSAAAMAYQRGFYRVVILLYQHGADISKINFKRGFN